MSLLDDSSFVCTMLDRTTVSDGYGGFVETWQDGASFVAAIGLDNSTQAQIALAEGAKGVYSVLTKRNINLRFHDVFRRENMF